MDQLPHSKSSTEHFKTLSYGSQLNSKHITSSSENHTPLVTLEGKEVEEKEEITREECLRRFSEAMERMPLEKLNEIIQNSNTNFEVKIFEILERKEIITLRDREDPIYDQIEKKTDVDWTTGVKIVVVVLRCIIKNIDEKKLSPDLMIIFNNLGQTLVEALTIVSSTTTSDLRENKRTSEKIENSLSSFLAIGIHPSSVDTHAKCNSHRDQGTQTNQEESFSKLKSSFDEDAEDIASISSVTCLDATQCTSNNLMKHPIVEESDKLPTSASPLLDGNDKGNQSTIGNGKKVHVVEMNTNIGIVPMASEEVRTQSSKLRNVNEETQTDFFGTVAGGNIIAEVEAFKNLGAQTSIKLMKQNSNSSKTAQQEDVRNRETHRTEKRSPSKRDDSNRFPDTKSATDRMPLEESSSPDFVESPNSVDNQKANRKSQEGVNLIVTTATLPHSSNEVVGPKESAETAKEETSSIEQSEALDKHDTCSDDAVGTILKPQDSSPNSTEENSTSSPNQLEGLSGDIQDSSSTLVRPECTTASVGPVIPALKEFDIGDEPSTVDTNQEGSGPNTVAMVLRRSSRKTRTTNKSAVEEREEYEEEYREGGSAKSRRNRIRRNQKRTNSRKTAEAVSSSAQMSSFQSDSVLKQRHATTENGMNADPLVPHLNYDLYKLPSTLSIETAQPTMDAVKNGRLPNEPSPQISDTDTMLAESSYKQQQLPRKRRVKTTDTSEIPKSNKRRKSEDGNKLKGPTQSTLPEQSSDTRNQAPNPIPLYADSNTRSLSQLSQMESITQTLPSLTNNDSSNQSFEFMNQTMLAFNQSGSSEIEVNQMARASDLASFYQPTSMNFAPNTLMNHMNGFDNHLFPQFGSTELGNQPLSSLNEPNGLMNQHNFEPSYIPPVQLPYQNSTDRELPDFNQQFDTASNYGFLTNYQGPRL